MSSPITILGAGLAGSLMTILLAKRGTPVRLLERRPDPRKHRLSAGRSINLALAARGIHALQRAGIYDEVAPLLVAMPGRMLHAAGQTQFVAYGQRQHEVIYSISRPGLNHLLLDCAERLPNVELQFDQQALSVDLAAAELTLLHEQRCYTQRFEHLIAADGYHSIVREALATQGVPASIEVLAHGYKELLLPAGSALQRHALHIWPRGNFMLIALPNLDGSFTLTLFLAFNSSGAQPGFDSLHSAAQIQAFFQQRFADVLTAVPDLAEQFQQHPTGKMATVRSSRWSNGTNAVLIGDAAHAMVPFHGQGMNCAFEDCLELDALLQQHEFGRASTLFEQQRQPQANAIADMALENYIEMRDTVRQPKFLLQKELSFELERLYPDRFIPRYSMVMFHHEIPYAEAYRRGAVQAQILEQLTQGVAALQQVDMQQAERLIQSHL